MDSQTLTGSTETFARLRAVPLFRDLADADLKRFRRAMAERSLQPGEIVVREGDPGEELFIVLEGDFQVFVGQEPLGFEKEVGRLGAGACFGEAALIRGGKQLASVRALTAGRVLVLGRQQLLELVGNSPGSALALCAGLIGYLAQAREALFAIPYVNLDDYPSLKEAHKLLPARIAAACEAVVVEHQDGGVKVALVNPHDTAARDFLQQVLRPRRVEFVATSQREFERYRDLHLGRVSAAAAPTEEVAPLAYVNPEGEVELLGEHETGQLLRQALTQALHFGASDVHFEPGVPEGRVRLRLDGKMMPLPEPVPARVFDQAVSRLKVMSGLDITEKRLPQDGRFPLRVGDRQIEVRVSVTPCQGGEKAVLRVLDAAQNRWDLENLILSRPVALLVKELFLAHSGLLLVCGPTGSGKTTTLYAGLEALWNDSHAVNIVTAEDPVEYQLGYATQIGVNRGVGLDFARVLRTILRQDPDVILVGEIRDEESAAIAVEAAMTGHLVLSSLHTDSAPEAVTRLRNLQVKPYLLAAGLRGVISQKLVPRVCRNCAAEVPADDPQVARLRAAGILPADWSKPLSRGRGCDVCRSEGEVGRVGVFEVLDVNDRLREAIEADAPWTEMRDALTSPLFVPMARYARYLLEVGVVSPERIREIFPARGYGDQPPP